jgi:hypothetical protein
MRYLRYQNLDEYITIFFYLQFFHPCIKVDKSLTKKEERLSVRDLPDIKQQTTLTHFMRKN